MADEKDLVSMAQSFTGLPMSDLIGGPLNAAAKANADMAATQVDFLLKTCFAYSPNTDPKKPGSYSPVMIKMSLTRGVMIPAELNPDGTVKTAAKIDNFETKFDLPILTIMPLNSLAVDKVDINFSMEVKSSYGEETSKKTETEVKAEASWEAKVGYGIFSASVTGSASYDSKDSSSFDTHYEKSNSAKYTVAVSASQLPLPKGVNVIIEAFTKAIEPYEMPAKAA